MHKPPFRLWIIALIVLLAALFFITRRLLYPGIEVVHPTRGTAIEAVYATGTVEATVMMPIAARSPARLMELNVDEGSHVTKDQVLARLEDTDLQNSIRELKAREQFARSDYERKSGLVQRGLISKESFDQAKTELGAASAATARAIAEAGYMKLVAPADGLIIQRDGEIGQMIPANEPVFWLSCCAPLRISSEVDEEDIAQVQVGQEVLIRADAFPGRVFRGKVQAITPKGDPVARSYRVRIEFSEDVPLKIGMTAETNIIIYTHENALLLPSSAVVQDKVWLVKDSKLTQQKVTIGAKGPDQTEILDGIGETEEVALKPSDVLQVGKKVRSKPAQPTVK